MILYLCPIVHLLADETCQSMESSTEGEHDNQHTILIVRGTLPACPHV